MARKLKTESEIAQLENEYITTDITLTDLAKRIGFTLAWMSKVSIDRDWKRKRMAFLEKKTNRVLEKQLVTLAEYDAETLQKLAGLAPVFEQGAKEGKFDNSAQALGGFTKIAELSRQILAGREMKQSPRLTVKLPDGTEITATSPDQEPAHNCGSDGGLDTATDPES